MRKFTESLILSLVFIAFLSYANAESKEVFELESASISDQYQQ